MVDWKGRDAEGMGRDGGGKRKECRRVGVGWKLMEGKERNMEGMGQGDGRDSEV